MLLPPGLREGSDKALPLVGMRSVEEDQASDLVSILLGVQTTQKYPQGMSHQKIRPLQLGSLEESVQLVDELQGRAWSWETRTPSEPCAIT